MEKSQKKVTSLGLDSHDLHILKITINILGHGVSSIWKYSRYSGSDVVFVDRESQEGRKYIREYKLGMHSNSIMVGVGEQMSNHPLEYQLTKPLRSMELRDVFGGLEGSYAN